MKNLGLKTKGSIALGKGDKMALKFLYQGNDFQKHAIHWRSVLLFHSITIPMENTYEPLDARLNEASSSSVELSEELAVDWLGLSGWTLFFSILMFLGAGIFLFIAVTSFSVNWETSLLLTGFAAVLFVPALLLARFRVNLKNALFHESPEHLEASFRAFRHFYLLMGILLICTTVLYFSLIATALLYATERSPAPNF